MCGRMELKINTDCFRECGASAAIVLAYIQLNANDEGVMVCKMPELAQQVGMSYVWVSQLVSVLDDFDYVDVERITTPSGYYKRVYLGRKSKYETE